MLFRAGEENGRKREIRGGTAGVSHKQTNRRGHSFLGVVASFIDEVFNCHTVLLSCEHIKGHHTAENIFHKYEGVLQHWSLQRCIVRVVTESASNMIKAFNLPGFDECAGEDEGEEDTEEGDTEDGQPSPFQPFFCRSWRTLLPHISPKTISICDALSIYCSSP